MLGVRLPTCAESRGLAFQENMDRGGFRADVTAQQLFLVGEHHPHCQHAEVLRVNRTGMVCFHDVTDRHQIRLNTQLNDVPVDMGTKSTSPLHSGAFANVYWGSVSPNNAPMVCVHSVAAKVFHTDIPRHEALAEVNALMNFRHPNIVNLYWWCVWKGQMVLMFERMECDMWSLIEEEKRYQIGMQERLSLAPGVCPRFRRSMRRGGCTAT